MRNLYAVLRYNNALKRLLWVQYNTLLRKLNMRFVKIM